MTSILKRLPAKAVVESYLASILPPGTPPRHRTVLDARYIGSGRNKSVTADLVMFDGLEATIEIHQWRHGLGHRWTRIEGNPAVFEEGRWRRLCEAGV